ncbi:hypothetical protein RJ55_06510 [Drechmeria coniospora]|nr:hypothetical protein RJ55_06510 [Drechmeria coniospora]
MTGWATRKERSHLQVNGRSLGRSLPISKKDSTPHESDFMRHILFLSGMHSLPSLPLSCPLIALPNRPMSNSPDQTTAGKCCWHPTPVHSVQSQDAGRYRNVTRPRAFQPAATTAATGSCLYTDACPCNMLLPLGRNTPPPTPAKVSNPHALVSC